MECKHLPNHGYVQGVLKKSERQYLWSLIGDLDDNDKSGFQKQLEDKDNYFTNTVLMLIITDEKPSTNSRVRPNYMCQSCY